MSNPSSASNIVKHLVKSKPFVLGPKVSFHTNPLDYFSHNNHNLDPKVYFHTVVDNTPRVPIPQRNNRAVTSGQSVCDTVQTQTSQPSIPYSATTALALFADARNSKLAGRNYSSTAITSMSDQLAKVLTKDACPRK